MSYHQTDYQNPSISEHQESAATTQHNQFDSPIVKMENQQNPYMGRNQGENGRPYRNAGADVYNKDTFGASSFPDN